MAKSKRQKGKARQEAARKRREQKAHLDIDHWQGDKRNTPKTLSQESGGEETTQKYPRAKRKIFLLLSGMLSLILGVPIFWEVFYADPIVRPPAESLDPRNPFAAPFTVFNKLYFHTLYHVQTSCYFDKRSTFISNIEFARGADVANIVPGKTISYTCPIEVSARPGISIVVRVQYEMRILWLFSRRGEIEVPFPLREGSKGEFHWVEGGYITRRGPEIWNGM